MFFVIKAIVFIFRFTGNFSQVVKLKGRSFLGKVYTALNIVLVFYSVFVVDTLYYKLKIFILFIYKTFITRISDSLNCVPIPASLKSRNGHITL